MRRMQRIKAFLGVMFILVVSYCSIQATGLHDKDLTKQEVWNTVQTINRHWAITENMDSLALYIHPDMVIFYPGGKVEGKEEIIESYRWNAANNETIKLEENNPAIYLYNDNKTGIVAYNGVLIVRNRENQINTFHYLDMYTLVYDKEGWRAVAQHYSFTK